MIFYPTNLAKLNLNLKVAKDRLPCALSGPWYIGTWQLKKDFAFL
jgi:hypothetical protein